MYYGAPDTGLRLRYGIAQKKMTTTMMVTENKKDG